MAISGYTHRVGQSFGGGSQGMERSRPPSTKGAVGAQQDFRDGNYLPFPLVWVLLPVHLSLLVVEGMLLSILKFRSAYLTEIYRPVVSRLFHRRRELKEVHSLIRAANPISAKAFFSSFNLVPYKLKMLLRHGLPKVI